MTIVRDRLQVTLAACGALFLACCAGQGVAMSAYGQQPAAIPACEVYEITGPTVIAFFDYANGQTDPNFNDALADFQMYLGRLRQRLDQSVVRVHECYRRSFEIRVAGKQQRFNVPVNGVGYYLVTPGRAPRIEREIVTDDDLIGVMTMYFGRPVVDRALARPR